MSLHYCAVSTEVTMSKKPFNADAVLDGIAVHGVISSKFK